MGAASCWADKALTKAALALPLALHAQVLVIRQNLAPVHCALLCLLSEPVPERALLWLHKPLSLIVSKLAATYTSRGCSYLAEHVMSCIVDEYILARSYAYKDLRICHVSAQGDTRATRLESCSRSRLVCGRSSCNCLPSRI